MKIYLAIINTGWIKTGLVNFILNMTGMHNVYFEDLKNTHAVPASHNRNQIVKRFLDTDCDWYLGIDNDVVPAGNPLDLLKLDKDIIGFPTKVWQGNSFHWNVYDLKDNGYHPVDMSNIESPILTSPTLIVGSGCLLIKRKVLETIKAPFHREWNEDGTMEYGLDFMFCRKAHESGFDVCCAVKCQCEHHKEVPLAMFANELLCSKE